MMKSIVALLLGLSLQLVPAHAAAPQTADSCECETQRPEDLATVNGVKIPTKQIEADTAGPVGAIKDQLDHVREQTLQTLITSRLLDLEAAKRGISTEKLLKTEVVANVAAPTAEEVRAFYDQNRQAIPQSFDEAKENIAIYILSQRQQVNLTILTTDLRLKADIKVLEYSPKAPANDADRAKVLALVNGSNITSGELEDSIRDIAYQAHRQIYGFEKVALDRRIDDVLIEQEAARRKVEVQAFVDAEVAPHAKKVDTFDASKFYNENKEQFGGRAFADVKDDLLKLLQQMALLDAKHGYAEGLRRNAAIKVALVEPAPPTYTIDTAGRPSIGAPAAPVTLVVFSDFQCGKCATAHGWLDELVKAYGGKVRVVLRNYPLEQHPMAYTAAEAAEAAFEQGKYWEYAGLVFENQHALSVEKLKELASRAGLDRAKFDAALDGGKFADVVDRDMSDGSRIGIVGTPSMYINGRHVDDDSPAGLKAAVDAALKGGG